MKPLPVGGPFDSIALNLVLHCLPGPMEDKEAAFLNLAGVLAPDGVLFGATVLGTSAEHSAAARVALRVLNRRGAFDNLGDSVDGLRGLLEHFFGDVRLTVSRSVARFVARSRFDV